jgi:hypothetical protein
MLTKEPVYGFGNNELMITPYFNASFMPIINRSSPICKQEIVCNFRLHTSTKLFDSDVPFFPHCPLTAER